MSKKNLYLMWILVVFFVATVIDVKIETEVFISYPNGIAFVPAILLSFLVFAWCIEHAKHYKIELPRSSAFLAGLIAPIGVPIYFFRGFGFKNGLFKTAKSIGFLILISVDVIFALWVADDPMFLESDVVASTQSETNDGFDDFDNENYESAFNKLKDLAILDNVDAQGRVAWMYYNGKGVVQDSNQAFVWYMKAAEQGDVVSQNNLAMFYREGEVVAQDYQKALKWFQIASEKEYPYAQINLGDMYAAGDGVEVSFDRARYWFAKAADNGSIEAKELLEMLTTKESAFE